MFWVIYQVVMIFKLFRLKILQKQDYIYFKKEDFQELLPSLDKLKFILDLVLQCQVCKPEYILEER